MKTGICKISQVEILQDGRFAVLTADGNKLEILSDSAFSEPWSFKESIASMRLLPSNRLALCTDSGPIRILDLNKNQIIKTLKHDDYFVSYLSAAEKAINTVLILDSGKLAYITKKNVIEYRARPINPYCVHNLSEPGTYSFFAEDEYFLNIADPINFNITKKYEINKPKQFIIITNTILLIDSFAEIMTIDVEQGRIKKFSENLLTGKTIYSFPFNYIAWIDRQDIVFWHLFKHRGKHSITLQDEPTSIISFKNLFASVSYNKIELGILDICAEHIQTLSFKQRINYANFNHDGRLLVALYDGTIEIYENQNMFFEKQLKIQCARIDQTKQVFAGHARIKKNC